VPFVVGGDVDDRCREASLSVGWCWHGLTLSLGATTILAATGWTASRTH
jgi:hypothetical protein